ncbi:MAG: hypothetical protein KAI70_07620, partial [Candidatus Omnitrophica bacterium]|nr:hypothetical protein [Candidatus Omnitrophota bacterium]
MDIGLGRESNPGEKRVVLLPEEVKELAVENNIYVERGAGERIGIGDDEYEKAGAKIVSKEKVYACSLVTRLKESKIEELALMRPGAAMMSMMHLSAVPDTRFFIEKQKIIAISLEEIKNPLNKRMVEALHQ